MSITSVALDEFSRLNDVVLIDCEFTCWEDSLRTRWADASRPPELIEITLVQYDIPRDRIGKAFASLVRPRLNPRLSDYCKNLTGISQDEIDRSPPLVEVLQRIETWLSTVGLWRAPVCEWATSDLPYLAQDAKRHGRASPFLGASHINLEALYRRVLGSDASGELDREAVRARYGLPANPGRHRALSDALELAHFCVTLRTILTQGSAG